MGIRLEFCAENATHIERALTAGAERIELCDNLAVGGTTPSYGVIQYALALAHARGARVMTMIRPRGGDFEYNKHELHIMETDLIVARKLGADGVVFGCLCNGCLDQQATKRLLSVAHGLDVTFHMAFDALPSKEDRLRAIDWLAEQGVRRILTHGGPPGTLITQNLAELQSYVRHAAGRIIIMPGGGVTYDTVWDICTQLGVHEAHGTRIVKLD